MAAAEPELADPAVTGDNGAMSADKNQKSQPDPVEDETKRKFREALEAKRGRQGEDHLDTGPKAQPHGRIEAKRTFRRKTG